MKRFASALLILLFLALSVNPSAECTEGWYLIKGASGRPGFPPSTKLITEQNGIYIDHLADKSGEKVIYLTFDAGYENGNVARILDTLKEKGVTGAFFILGNLIKREPELVCRMANEGHLVCNHTYTHKNINSMSEEDARCEIDKLSTSLREELGIGCSAYFRFPEGTYSEARLKTVNEMGYRSVFWSIAYADWDNGNQMSGEKAIATLLRQTHPGAIVLLHPTSETNAEILGELIDRWRDMGYRFGSLTDIE